MSKDTANPLADRKDSAAGVGEKEHQELGSDNTVADPASITGDGSGGLDKVETGGWWSPSSWIPGWVTLYL